MRIYDIQFDIDQYLREQPRTNSVTDGQPAGKKPALASATAPRQGTKAGEHGGRRAPDAIEPVPVSHTTPPSAICASCRIFEIQPGSTMCPRCTRQAAIRADAAMRKQAHYDSVDREVANMPVRLSRLDLSYTDPTHLSRIHRLDGDTKGDTIEVVGDPDNASYEWVIRRGDEIKHSDAGYGMPEVALRDALIEYYGPRDFEPATRTAKVRP